MSGQSFTLNIITPVRQWQREVSSLRLKDETGFFGILKGHMDFLTVLVPSVGYYTEAGRQEIFLAVDGGLFSVRQGTATLLSREVFESDDAEKLSGVIEEAFKKREEAEKTFSRRLEGIERSFLEKTAELMRGES